MSIFEIILTLIAYLLVYQTTEYRENAVIVAREFGATLLATFILITLEGHLLTGACWVFGVRAIILYVAMRATLKVKGHRMVYIVMLLGMAVNVGAYFEYATKNYGVFDEYYGHAARAVMSLQLVYILGIGYVGSYLGRLRVAGVRRWRAYRLPPERREIIGGSKCQPRR